MTAHKSPEDYRAEEKWRRKLEFAGYRVVETVSEEESSSIADYLRDLKAKADGLHDAIRAFKAGW